MTKEYIRNCAWGYSCDQKWDKLTATHNFDIKFCEACQREVYRCETQEELAENITLNRCVNFSSDITNIIDTEFLQDKTPQGYTGFAPKPSQDAPNKKSGFSSFDSMEPTIDFDDDIPF
ncbi:hypothetical protein [Pseudoalteromonas agarivorans]|uniref:hypothetical protein n=1 Tax=Pseudoalteromonas agarivorans TaxID=176102 RepID=UPI003B8A7C32|tara:strand:+ start:537 stop:893 length:357 start_codon:yes stop_codon:yes gene_type:complete